MDEGSQHGVVGGQERGKQIEGAPFTQTEKHGREDESGQLMGGLRLGRPENEKAVEEKVENQGDPLG